MSAVASAWRRPFLPLVVALTVFAWFTLLIWEASPYGRYLDHGQWTEIGLAASLCHILPEGPLILPALLYVGGWLLMSLAMMLPTTLPLLAMFDRVTAGRADQGLLIALVIAGYLAIWAAFGLVAHGLDALLHALVHTNTWLTFNGWIVGAIVLASAGAFQFSALKHHCLEQCRTPFSFVNAHWRGGRARWQALRLGFDHGAFCVGCCWAIMLLMFVVGTGSVGWMLALGAVMAIEKNVRWGRRLSAPVGVALLVCSGAIVATHAWGWT